MAAHYNLSDDQMAAEAQQNILELIPNTNTEFFSA